MVSFKRKPVTIPKPSRTPVNKSAPVWVIEQTLEYFDNYDAYLKRMEFYNQKKFICELTGHSCLNYFEAVEKEAREARAVVTDFPDPPKEPILQRVQFSRISRLDLLVDKVYTAVRHEFFVGEILHARTRDQQRMRVTVEEVLPPLEGLSEKRYRCGHEFYPNRFDVFQGKDLFRDRKTFNKMSVRTFIKYAASRENWQGCPWIVRKEYTDKYPTIPTELPEDLQLAYKNHEVAATFQPTAAEQPVSTKTVVTSNTPDPVPTPTRRRKAPAKVIEGLHDKNADDLDILATATIGPKYSEKVKQWPQWKLDSQLDQQVTGRALQIWSFLNVYNEMLVLSPISYDEFVRELNSEQDSLLVAEIICSILTIFVDPGEDILAVPFPSQYEPSSKRRRSKHAKLEGINDDDSDNDKEDEDENDDNEENDANPQDHDVSMDEGEEEEGESTSSNHNAEEYITLGGDWMVRIGKRDFTNGGWQSLVICTLSESSYMREWLPTIEPLLAILADPETKVSLASAKKNWLNLNATQKVQVLDILVQILHTSPALRQFMDQRGEQSTRIRKERAEISRQHRVVTDSLRVIRDKRTAAEVDDPEVEKEFAETIEQQDTLAEKIADLNNQLFHYDCHRLRLLGKDRFYNRYWWFESNGMERVHIKTENSEDNFYLMSRIWVQGPTVEDFNSNLDSTVANSRITELRDKAAEIVWQEKCRTIALEMERREAAKKTALLRAKTAKPEQITKAKELKQTDSHTFSVQPQPPVIRNKQPPSYGFAQQQQQYRIPQFVQPAQPPQPAQPVQPAQPAQQQQQQPAQQPQFPQMPQFQIQAQQRPVMSLNGMPMYYPQPIYPQGMPQMIPGMVQGQYLVPMAMPQYPQVMGQQVVYMVSQNINGVQTLVPAQIPGIQPQQFANGQMPMMGQFPNGQVPQMQIEQIPMGQPQSVGFAQPASTPVAQPPSQDPNTAHSQPENTPVPTSAPAPSQQVALEVPAAQEPAQNTQQETMNEPKPEPTLQSVQEPAQPVEQPVHVSPTQEHVQEAAQAPAEKPAEAAPPALVATTEPSVEVVSQEKPTINGTTNAEVISISPNSATPAEPTVEPQVNGHTVSPQQIKPDTADTSVMEVDDDTTDATVVDTAKKQADSQSEDVEMKEEAIVAKQEPQHANEIIAQDLPAKDVTEVSSGTKDPTPSSPVNESSDTEDETAPNMPPKEKLEPLTVLELKKQFENDAIITKPNEWRYYDSAEDLGRLLKHFMRTTPREGELMERLVKLESSIRESFRVRESLQNQDSKEWTNKLAQETIGHFHSSKSRKRGKRG